jgi:N-formylglutamate deformylase
MNAAPTAFTLHQGSAPLLISLPHNGTEIPDEIARQLVPRALNTEDADWHVDRLYAFAKALGASVIVPRYARYVIDLNRPPENAPMYPGQHNTELCPTRFFTGEPMYREGLAPNNAEVQRRMAAYWQPYHAALQGELARMKAAHGRAMLLDGHSIQAELPWLFEGRLPDLNLGTVNGTSCAPALRERLAAIVAAQGAFSHALDGRFKGGYITRHYGRPQDGVHAVQMEMAQHCYLRPPHAYDEAIAARVQPTLRALAQAMLSWPV